MPYVIPPRQDLFLAARSVYGGTAEAIEAYRMLSATLQNPGLVVDDAFIMNLHELYMQLRAKLVDAFHADIPGADRVFASILAALQASPAPPGVCSPVPGVPAIPKPDGTTVPITAAGAATSPGGPPVRRYVIEGGYPRPEPGTKKPGRRPSAIPWPDAIDQIDGALELLDQLPERAGDFVTSAGDKLRSMRAWIDEHHYVTDKMASAITNLEAGASKWLRR